MLKQHYRAVEQFAAPAGVLGVATLAAFATAANPSAAAGILPAVVLLISVLLSLWFNRGRAFLASVSLLLAYAAYAFTADPQAVSFAHNTVIAGIAIFVPLNFALISQLRERGILHFRSYRWLLLFVSEATVITWIASAGNSALSGVAWHGVLNHWLLHPAPIPVAGHLLFAAALVLVVGRIRENKAPVEIGLGAALLAFFMGCAWHATPGTFAAFVSAAGVMVLVSVLQESHRMAFRDELTGLAGRRMLEEQLLGLGPVFTVAMVDVDHFKKFNDTHGHEVGDQVLKMVGARLEEVGGHGRAFRYGGEEFAVLFADTTIEEALPHLEQLRRAIGNHAMVSRRRDRRRGKREEQDRRSQAGTRFPEEFPSGSAGMRESLSVTVSIGVAERNRRLHTSAMVIRAADEALYRAKGSGRNRISR